MQVVALLFSISKLPLSPATLLQLRWRRADLALARARVRLPPGGGLWPHPAGRNGALDTLMLQLLTQMLQNESAVGFDGQTTRP